VIEHREIEAPAVPRDKLRRVFVDEIEEATDELRLGISRLPTDAILKPLASRAQATATTC
jgi:hypothetical protein